MKDGVMIINTGRGGLLNTADAIEALKSGKIGYLGLDVYENEPEIGAGLLEMNNVVLLPHIGSATLETRTAMAMLAVENVIDALSGRTPRSLVR